MDSQKQQALERLQQANNVLVTVSQNPSVDQLAAAIGFTLFLTKLDKHATAVFSGQIPSTIEFLKPDQTIETNTDSLRDFIISLDKSKADKLRYKVEEDHVKVFITPYRTSITEADLEFSQGDFNVDVVVALGVNEQKDLDQAITAHGRILHDATVISVTNGPASALGSINWANDKASSLCEMITELSDSLQSGGIDNQMATALLTGIVAETARFSNEKTSSTTMTISAKLMAAGANQQLVASELQKTTGDVAAPAQPSQPGQEAADGTLQIGHPVEQQDEIHVDDQGDVSLPEVAPEAPPAEDQPADAQEQPAEEAAQDQRRVPMTEPPQLGGVLTASGRPEDMEPPIDPLLGVQNGPLLTHDAPAAAQADEQPAEPELPDLSQQIADITTPPAPVVEEQPAAPAPEPELPVVPPAPEPDVTPTEPVVEEGPGTLADLERSVGSLHVDQGAEAPAQEEVSLPLSSDEPGDLDQARDAVMQAINEAPSGQPLPPIAALNAQPIDLNKEPEQPVVPAAEPDLSLPPGLIPEDKPPVDVTGASVDNPIAPPPVPPPMMPPMPGFDPGAQLPALPTDDQNDQNIVQLPPAEPPKGDQNNPFGLPPA